MPRRTNKQATKKASKKTLNSDAIHMLTEDHRKVEQLFEQCLDGAESDRAEIVRHLIAELEVHSKLEEEIFYPAIRDTNQETEVGEDAESVMNGGMADENDLADDDEESLEDDEEDVLGLNADAVESALEDHQEMKEQTDRVKRMEATGEDLREAVAELQDIVADHVSDEEEILFPWARHNLDTKTLGKQMRDRKQELEAGVA